jgi:RND family efflux transporter MFP subunit
MSLWACGHGHDHPDGSSDHPGGRDAEERVESITTWSDKTELFMEFSPFVAGEPSDLLVHLTRLDTFEAVGGVTVRADFTYADESRASFENFPPKRDGIFRVTAKPPKAGRASLVIVVSSDSYDDSIDCGEVEIYGSRNAIPEAHSEEEADTIPFLKEQQWNIAFATSEAKEEEVRTGVPVTVTVEPLPGRDALIAPLQPGLVEPPSGGFPAPGSYVEEGQALAYLVPAVAEGTSLADLEADRATAEAEYSEAEESYRRAEKLFAAEAISEKRHREARNRSTVAKARLKAAKERLGAARGVSSNFRLPLVSPMAGTLVESNAVTGAAVTGGSALFRVIHLDRVRLRVNVSEADLGKLGAPAAVEVELPGGKETLAREGPSGVGDVIDPVTRTLPVYFDVDNAQRVLKIGMNLKGFVFSEKTFRALTVPTLAVLIEEGMPHVYLQVEGEAFERRSVVVGPRSGRRVAVLSGLDGGERVVSKGAYDIRLASLSGVIPEHGHAH